MDRQVLGEEADLRPEDEGLAGAQAAAEEVAEDMEAEEALVDAPQEAGLEDEQDAQRARLLQDVDRAQERMQSDLARIRSKYPFVTAQDVGELGAQFLGYIARGEDGVRAFEISHIDEIIAQRAALESQKAAQRLSQKEHLRPTLGRPVRAVTMPSEVLKLYKQLNPKASDAEIRRDYALDNQSD